ncbi:MAG: NUDIX hydrolase [Candidatus Andersenbacteria bacterium]
MKVREDKVEFQNNVTGIYGVVDKPDFALIVPLVDNSFYLVRQYRYPVEGSFWEFPQGSYEEDPNIDPAQLALNELQEETGLVAKHIEKIGYQYASYGFSSQGFHIFLAKNFKQEERKLEATEEGMEVKQFSISEFEQLVRDGEVRDAPTISAYGLLKMEGILMSYLG